MQLIGIVQLTANIAASIGIIYGAIQIFQNKKLRNVEFENTINDEYRSIIKEIPWDVFVGKELENNEHYKRMDDYYRYFDLSNNEIILRMNKRISYKMWKEWESGIKDFLKKIEIEKAYNEIVLNNEIFNEIYYFVKRNINNDDPYKWNKKDFALTIVARAKSKKAPGKTSS
jgi:hypothetical protein